MSIELETPDKLEYQFHPVTSGSLNFKIKAPNDAHVALTAGPEEADPMYEVPPEAVPGGFDGEQLYVGRAQHEGALIPGKVVPSHGVCYVAWGGAEHGKEEYQVLCGCDVTWVPSAGGEIPSNALPSGETEDGEPLFTGRAQHEGTVTVGKVQASHNVCYIPYGGQELGYPDYEVLVPK
ncbi:uncharacterized protein GBIM_04492 [Gryllus bimaculatus]|nr:uncharacterized protein GBIM_04492 [Gryllus bimaculatus]